MDECIKDLFSHPEFALIGESGWKQAPHVL